MLARSKLNSIETLISQTLIDLKISHAEFKTIVNEEENYKKVKKKKKKKNYKKWGWIIMEMDRTKKIMFF